MATEAQPAKHTKVLVVEDDVMIRVVLADMLCELGYTVAAEAASIDEALEATRKTDFDLSLIEATDNLTSLHEHEEKLRAGSLEPSFAFSEAGAGDLI